MVQVNIALDSTYAKLIELTLGADIGVVNSSLLSGVQNSLLTIEEYRMTLPYSDNFSSFINQVFYNSSCSIVTVWFPSLNCSDYLQGNRIPNPFDQGLSFYLTTLSYYIKENITEVQKATGLLGTPFYYIFKELIAGALSEWDQYTTNNLSYVYICLLYNLVNFGVMCTLVVLSFFNNSSMIEETRNIRKILITRTHPPADAKQSLPTHTTKAAAARSKKVLIPEQIDDESDCEL